MSKKKNYTLEYSQEILILIKSITAVFTPIQIEKLPA